MKKVELLAPAGNMEALKAAVNAGCDAVYLGLKSFSARAFAGNFSHEEFIEAIHYCHTRNVKIYCTINTMLYETEIENAKKEVDFLYENDCDIPVAKALATDVVAEKAFMPVSDENKNRMYKLLESVDYVIDCGCGHGEYDKINSEIIRLAESKGKLTDISSL